MAWGIPTGKGSRSDVLLLRDAVLKGDSFLSIAREDSTCKASAQFMRFSENLREAHRAEVAKKGLKEAMTGVELRDWQEQVVDKLDKCGKRLRFPTHLVFHPGRLGNSYFEEFGMFKIHEYP